MTDETYDASQGTGYVGNMEPETLGEMEAHRLEGIVGDRIISRLRELGAEYKLRK